MKKALVLVLVFCAAAFALPDLSRPAVTRPDGERHVAGQLIIELAPALRGRVALGNADGVALFGVPALDELSRRWQVNDITPLMRHPQPSAIARQYGCDLQYIVQFGPEQDVDQVGADYEALPEVEYACPNGLMALDEEPNDPSYHTQWHLAKIGAPYAWGVAKGDTAVYNMVVDDGCDWEHPDIEDNLWINAAEDINHNGRFDTGDENGVDEDMNGYMDDVIGWNFQLGTNNPMPQSGDAHGTHCWGNVNAVTNNSEGVAGTTWNTRSLAVCCGGGGYVNIYAAISAIYYAVPEGIWAYSMSFGSSSPYQPMADACQYAWDTGVVGFGSAGNDGSEVVRYPGCYSGVENVAASGPQDTRTSWSNYGTWVDITAPGSGIYTTVPRSSGSYGSMDGTSMSCPLASGVACWMKSFDNTMSAVSCTARMHAAADTMPDDMYRQGKLGAGRVSMANVILPLYYCDLHMTAWRFNDAAGNNNGRPDPGETAALIVTYANTSGWRDATGVSATLTCGQTSIQVIKGTATFPDIPAGGSASCSADSFVISVPGDNPPQRLDFFLTVDANPDPAYTDTSFSVNSGDPRVLIVDDDLGQNYERWYTSACDSNGILYHTWTVQASGSPTSDTLSHYPIVIWFTGDDSLTTLTTTDETNLTSFLTNGGKLVISGQNIAQDISADPFLADYLHAQFIDPSTKKPYMVSVPGDPIIQEDTMVAGGGGGANNGSSLDGIKPLGGATGCAFYKDYADPEVRAVVKYKDGYAVVFFSVPFEAIDHATSRYLQKWTLIKRIFDWFGERVPGVEERPPVAGNPRPYVLNITPNPFSQHCRVQFIAPVSGQVELRTYATDGRMVSSQAKQVTLGERAYFDLDGKGLANGTYLVQLVTSDGVFAQKAAVLR